MTLVDTHAHLYHARFDEDREAILDRATASGVARFYLPNIDAGSISGMLDLAERHPSHCFAMMGVHPCSIGQAFETELALAESWLFQPPQPVRFVAVGEIGLDYYWDKTFVEQQKVAYLQQLDWAARLDLPVAIHSRDSLEDTIGLVEGLGNARLRGVYHCFNGTLEQARRITDMGFFLGIGGVATYKNGGLDRVLPGIDPDFVVLETDAPFLAPVPHRGKRNEPAYLTDIAAVLARWYGTTPQAIAQRTTENANRLFRFA